MFLCWKHLKTCGQTMKHCFHNKNVSEFVGGTILLPGKQIFFPQQGPGLKLHAEDTKYFFTN